MEFSPLKITIIGSHKILGTFIFTLVVLRLMWRFFNTQPQYESIPKLHKITSNIVHFFLYILVIIIPIQGTYMTWLGGSSVSLLGIYEINSLIEMNFILYQQQLKIHYYSALILTSIFTIHIFAALYHKFFINDHYGVWSRMISKK